MQLLVNLKGALVVELFRAKITEKFLLVLLHRLSVTVQLCDVGVSRQVKTKMSPGIGNNIFLKYLEQSTRIILIILKIYSHQYMY